MKSFRRRVERGSPCRHEAKSEVKVRARALRRRRSKEISVHVHVHDDREGATATVEPPRATKPRPRLAFTGPLFGWRDHYEPIVKRYAATAEVEERRRRRRSVFKRSRWLLLTGMLAALVALSCLFL